VLSSKSNAAAVELTEKLSDLDGFLFVEVIGKERIIWVLNTSTVDWHKVECDGKVWWCESSPVLL
jgi:hypothetical protein